MQNRVVKGTLIRWRDDKGFGFIKLESGYGADIDPDMQVFIHVSALGQMSRRPMDGDIIRFNIEHKSNGRLNALNAIIEGVDARGGESQSLSQALSLALGNTKTGADAQAKSYQANDDPAKTRQAKDVQAKNSQPLSPLCDEDKPQEKKAGLIQGILKRIAIMMMVLAVVGYAYERITAPSTVNSSSSSTASNTATSNGVQLDEGTQEVIDAYQHQQSGVHVIGSGIVSKLLDDDINGSQHQRFILSLYNGQTVLVAHNIDLALRVDAIEIGDRVVFSGVYEFNKKGGVVHWTHHDPKGQRAGGWLKHNGQEYR